jgi:hypothetical protein
LFDGHTPASNLHIARGEWSQKKEEVWTFDPQLDFNSFV